MATQSNNNNGNNNNENVGVVIDTSTISLLEHVNLNVPSHEHVLEFYGHILGMGLDPRRAQNFKKGEGTLWFNCGASQFHLPYGETAQVWKGHLGLTFPSLEPLQDRLTSYDDDEDSNNSKPYAEYTAGVNESNGQPYIRIVDHYGNIFFCRKDDNASTTSNALKQKQQPSIQSSNDKHVEEFGLEFCETHGGTAECTGLKYVEYNIPVGTASKISLFYESIFDATTQVINDDVCLVACGSIDDQGRAQQYMIFRETPVDNDTNNNAHYDGHHVAIYVGSSIEDFEVAFERSVQAGIVWVNPRFSDRATTLETAREWNQFRFKDIIDIDTGKVLFPLEHEVRSIHHNAHPN